MDAATPDAAPEVLHTAGMSPGLAAFIADALREHDAAGRPPIALPTPEEALRDHRTSAALAPLFVAAAVVLDGMPHHIAAMVEAAERDGVEGAHALLATLDPQLGARLAAVRDARSS